MISQLTLEQKLQGVILMIICFIAVANYLIK
jgi:cbb3-type cytochrome oxidase subunit 3